MNSGSSASIGSGGQLSLAASRAAWYLRSRPSCQVTLAPVRSTTSTVLTFGQLARALSTFCFSATGLPPRTPSSAVIMVRQSASRMRSRRASGEKPPNTTECTAPIRRAGQHGVGRFGDHRHVDTHAITFVHTTAFQDVGQAADVLVQLTVSNRGRILTDHRLPR